MKNQVIFYFTFFLTGLIWLIIVPIWHFPDEQSHFGQVAFIAEKGRNPKGSELDLTEEIYASELFLGTARDKLGNNKFTFHKEYKLVYTNSVIGKYEASIAALTKTNAKNTFVHQEAARYPQLYYIPASIIYKLFYTQDLFTRVFAVRIWSLLLFMFTIYITYKIGILLFPKDKLFASVLTILVAFQPMMIFSNVGVNSDALGNLLFTLFLFICLKIILSGFSILSSFFLLTISILSIYTKPQFIVMVPNVSILFLFIFLRDFSLKHKYKLSILLVLISLAVIYLLYLCRISSFVIIDRILANFDIGSFIKFTWEYTIPHLIKEVLPWYWGIYDWLGVTYPRVIHRIINRIVMVALLGFGYWFYKNLKEKKWRKRTFQGIIYLLYINFSFFLAVSIFDWLSWYTQGYQLGVQGRYFFPLISVHMLLLLIGWQTILPNIWKLKVLGIKFLGMIMIIFNNFAIYLVTKTYYNILPLSTLSTEISQYKPWFFKGTYLVILIFLYLISLILLFKYISKNELVERS